MKGGSHEEGVGALTWSFEVELLREEGSPLPGDIPGGECYTN